MSQKKAQARKIQSVSKQSESTLEYEKFDELDGRHPWMTIMPEGHIAYPVRELKKGKVAYFNFSLAREMGLIHQDHPEKLSKELEKKILDTFSIRIINEFDQQSNIRFTPNVLKKHAYMATRYLQLQHDNKQGKTSGDGRCVWNGTLTYQGKTWDISSRGVGVTALSPGSVEAGKPLESGSTEFGYGCGLAEIDELYGSAIMSEIFHCNEVNTERMLAIIDLGENIAIGVRAGTNLFRPAHLFLYLKQKEYDALKRATDFLIDRNYSNGEWDFNSNHPNKYQLLLEEICEHFAQFAAQLDRDYIFAWLDWDGDNVLFDGGIIDYGSIRQFGLRHDQYRFDDVERFSTNLNEQKSKARLTVQVFAQMVDYLQTSKRKPLATFNKNSILKKFDRHFKYYVLDRFLYQIGLPRKARELLLKNHHTKVSQLYRDFSYFERRKTKRKLTKMHDGVNRPAIFNMRAFMREFPSLVMQAEHPKAFQLQTKDFLKLIISEFASRRDRQLKPHQSKRVIRFQKSFREVLFLATKDGLPDLLHEIAERATVINLEDRITGNALIHIVDEIMRWRRKGVSHQEIQEIMQSLISMQNLAPQSQETALPRLHSKEKELMGKVLKIVHLHREDI